MIKARGYICREELKYGFQCPMTPCVSEITASWLLGFLYAREAMQIIGQERMLVIQLVLMYSAQSYQNPNMLTQSEIYTVYKCTR